MSDNHKKLYILILSFILVACISFTGGYYLGRADFLVLLTQQNSNKKDLQPQAAATLSPKTISKNNLDLNKCLPYGMLTKDDYLITYYVQKGDTLFSILKNQNWGTSRINDLIEINKDVYPGLSLNNPFIEVGWKLYLPPKSAGTGSGHYAGVQGEIAEINKTSMKVNQNPNGADLITINFTSFTQFVPSDYKLSEGKCVRVVFDQDFDNKAISVVAEN